MEDARVAKWLRSVELTPGSARQAAIVNAADEFAASAEGPAVAAMVELAFKHDSGVALSSLGELIRELDTTYSGHSDDLETQLAAGILIAEVLDADSPVSVCAGHAVLSAEWAGLAPALTDLPTLASASLDRQAEAQRERDAQQPQPPRDIVVPEFPQDSTPITHVEAAPLAAAISAFSANTNLQAQQIETLRQCLRAGDEELNILWWAFSGYSEHDVARWSEINSDGRAAVLAGLEFGGKIEFDTEPRRSEQILRRVLGERGSNEISLDKAIEQAAVGDLRLPETIPDHVLLPVLVSLRECGQLNGKLGWIDSVGRWDIDPKRTVTCAGLARQTVRELLLVEQLV